MDPESADLIAVEMTPEMISLCSILHDSRPTEPAEWAEAVKEYSRDNAARRSKLSAAILITVTTQHETLTASVLPQAQDLGLSRVMATSAVGDLILCMWREMIEASNLYAIEERSIVNQVRSRLQKLIPGYVEGAAGWSPAKVE